MKILAMLAISAGLLFGAVDINNATKDQLMSIKGVGDKKADAIIEYRKGHCFRQWGLMPLSFSEKLRWQYFLYFQCC